jgi:FkbM family methyltransferase
MLKNAAVGQNMKKKLKLLIPAPLREWHRRWHKKNRERRFFRQCITTIKCGDFEIEAPEDHPLKKLLESQSSKDVCVGIAAKFVSAKYPNGTILDIGANIGDTAAIIATYSKNKLVLVEASDYYFDILCRNASRIPNVQAVKKSLISDGTVLSGSFSHWGGTANFHEEIAAKKQTKSQRLCDVAGSDTCFIKIDTDGYDFKILRSSVEWLGKVQPAILFENWLRNSADFADANALYSELSQIGYMHFIVWDASGFHLVSTSSLDTLKHLNRYLFKSKVVDYYDILCLHQKDEDIYTNISEWYINY